MISLAELQQQLSNQNSDIVLVRKKLNRLVEYFKSRPEYEEQVYFYSLHRKLEKETLLKEDAFMVLDSLVMEDIPEEFRNPRLGFVRNGYLVYSGRFVFPIKDIDGDVAGFVGNDAFEQPKYLDSKNIGYKANTTMIAGMEQLADAYRSDYPVIFVEGKIDQLTLKECGFVAFSTLGSYLSPYQMEIIKRFGRRAITIWDNDEAGYKATRITRQYLPQALTLCPTKTNDIDDIIHKKGYSKEQLRDEIMSLYKNPFKRVELLTRKS